MSWLTSRTTTSANSPLPIAFDSTVSPTFPAPMIASLWGLMAMVPPVDVTFWSNITGSDALRREIRQYTSTCDSTTSPTATSRSASIRPAPSR